MRNIFELVESASQEELPLAVAAVIKSCLPELKTKSGNYIAAAYFIAGLASAENVRNLHDNNIDHIITLAGELEINPPDRELLRAELIEAIEQLKSVEK